MIRPTRYLLSGMIVLGAMMVRASTAPPSAGRAESVDRSETRRVAHSEQASLSVYHSWRTYTTADGLPSDKVLAVRVADDRVWVGTDAGLAYSEGERWRSITVDDGLAHRVVLALDANPLTGDVWIGTMGGLNRWSAGRLETFDQFNSGLANDVVYGVSSHGEYVWAATAAGAARLNTTTGEWTIFDDQSAPMHEPWTYGVHINDGKAYIAAWGGGVLEYDLTTQQWRDYRDPDGEMEIDLFPDDGLVHDITTGVSFENGTLWVGTYFGLSRYDGARWSGYFDDDSGLISNFINFVRAKGPVVWICTDNGLSSFDGDTWVTYQRDSLSTSGQIIVTRADQVSQRPSRTTVAHNYILGVDFRGDTIWVATARGLSRGTDHRALTSMLTR